MIMKKLWHELKGNEKGQALVVVLCFLVIGGLTIAPSLNYAATSLNAGQVHKEKMQQLYAADAGAEYAMWQLAHNALELPESGQTVLPEFLLNNNAVNVVADNVSDNVSDLYRIISTANDNHSSTTVETYMTFEFSIDDVPWEGHEGNFILEPGEEYTGDVHAEGNIQLGENSTINGHCRAEGNVQLDAGATINGHVVCEGNVQIQMAEGAVINGSVISQGSVQIVAHGLIDGNVIAQGNVQLGPWTTITGGVCTEGNCQLGQEAVIQGSVHGAANVELGPDAIIGGDVHVGDTVTLGPGAQINGDYPLPYEGCLLSLIGEGCQILSWEIK